MNKGFRRELIYSLLLLLASAIFGMGFVSAKWAFEAVTPLYFVFFRFSIASLALVIFCGPKRLRKITKEYIGPAIAVGTAFGAAFIVQAVGLGFTSASNTAFITGIYVVFVPFIGVLWKRKLSLIDVLIAVIAAFGLAIFSLSADFSINPGDLIVLIATLAFAVQCLLVAQYANRFDGLLLNFLQILVATLWAGASALIFESPPSLSAFDFKAAFGILYCAIFASAFGRYIQMHTQKLLPPTTASIIITSQAIFGAFFSFIFLQEIFTARQFGGAAILIICMVAAVSWPHLMEKRKQKAATVNNDENPAEPTEISEAGIPDEIA